MEEGTHGLRVTATAGEKRKCRKGQVRNPPTPVSNPAGGRRGAEAHVVKPPKLGAPWASNQAKEDGEGSSGRRAGGASQPCGAPRHRPSPSPLHVLSSHFTGAETVWLKVVLIVTAGGSSNLGKFNVSSCVTLPEGGQGAGQAHLEEGRCAARLRGL